MDSGILCRFRPSPKMAALFLPGGIAASACVWIIPIPLAMRIAAVALAVFLSADAIRRHAFRMGKDAVAAVRLEGAPSENDGDLQRIALEFVGGKIAFGHIASVFVTAPLTVFCARLDESPRRFLPPKIYPIIALADSLAADDYRRLRVRLHTINFSSSPSIKWREKILSLAKKCADKISS